MAKMGRPRLPDSERKSQMVGLALPAKQYEQVQQIAETSERSMSSVVREALENYLEEHND